MDLPAYVLLQLSWSLNVNGIWTFIISICGIRGACVITLVLPPNIRSSPWTRSTIIFLQSKRITLFSVVFRHKSTQINYIYVYMYVCVYDAISLNLIAILYAYFTNEISLSRYILENYHVI